MSPKNRLYADELEDAITNPSPADQAGVGAGATNASQNTIPDRKIIIVLADLERTLGNIADPERIVGALGAINDDFNRIRQPVIQQFQLLLNALEGRSFGNFAANRRVAVQIQWTAHRMGMAFLCPKCDRLARLKCVQAGNSKEGVFSFAHTGGTHGAPNTLPKLILIEKSPSPPLPAAESENS